MDEFIGKCFVWLGDDGKLATQGVIRSVYDGLALVQYFDAFVGAPSTLAIVRLSSFASQWPDSYRAPNTAIIFDNDSHMRDWLENGFGQHYAEGGAAPNPRRPTAFEQILSARRDEKH